MSEAIDKALLKKILGESDIDDNVRLITAVVTEAVRFVEHLESMDESKPAAWDFGKMVWHVNDLKLRCARDLAKLKGEMQ